MKTSKLILIIAAGILIAFWVVLLLTARKDIKTILSRQDVLEYKSVVVEPFTSLDFSSGWIVTIKQGKDCRVELAFDEDPGLEPQLDQSGGTLLLTCSEDSEDGHEAKAYARITAPYLRQIKAAGDSEISMKMFWSDSLRVILDDGASYSGSKNDFDYITFKAAATEPGGGNQE